MTETDSLEESKPTLAEHLKLKYTSKPTATQLLPKFQRPEFVNGVRVRMPDDYDFSTKGTAEATQASIGRSTRRIFGCALTRSGRNTS